MEYFKIETITPSMKSITDLTKVRSFLIEGTKSAVLVDTGTGVGHLAEFVRTVTQKPLSVLCTHAHPDHMGAVEEFDTVYLNEKDFEMAHNRCGMERRREYAEFMLEREIDVNSLYFIPARTRGYQKLLPEMEFDLGGVTVKALEFPGHTQGMMAILIKEERNVILGDACNRRVFLFSEESSMVAEYRKACYEFKTSYGKLFDTLYMSHGPLTLDYSLLQNMIDTCDDILAGRDDKVEIDFMGEKAYLAKKEISPGVREDGKIGNIAYALHKLGK